MARNIGSRRVGELLKELARATPQEAGAVGGNAKAVNLASATAPDATAYREALQALAGSSGFFTSSFGIPASYNAISGI